MQERLATDEKHITRAAAADQRAKDEAALQQVERDKKESHK